MERLLLFTKSHWKKLTIASIPVIYGISYAKNEYQTYKHMQNFCNMVSRCSVPKQNKILVVLNPVANNKRCEKTFKKYCEPVLHMVGYEVDIVKTRHVGHAKSLMEELQELPDAIVVAGGDGTSSEVVTGLVRRHKEICPILFLPLGEKSATSLSLMHGKLERNSEFVKNVSQCLLHLIQGHIEHRPLIKYQLIENDSPVQSKPIFGIQSFSWGIIRDIEINKEKYWYFGGLKHHVSLLIGALSKKLNESVIANVVSTPPCPGCNKCEIIVKNSSRFNISKLLRPQVSNKPTPQLQEHKLCSTENRYRIDAKQIDITCKENSESFFSLNTRIIENITSRSDFIINMMRDNEILPSTLLESRTIEVIPIKSEQQNYYIDGEAYDARHVKISLLSNALKYFS